MGHLFFFLAVLAACLLWSATLTAAAARVRRFRWLLEALALLVPLLALAPAVAVTWFLAFGPRPLANNWFAPTITTFLSAAIGCWWIVWAGLTRKNYAPLRFSSEPVPLAARWPLVGLAAMFLLAKACSAGALLFIDNAVSAQAPYLRLEAAQLMQANLPPAVADADNAAALYERAFRSIDAEAAAGDESSPLKSSDTVDVRSQPVTDLLARTREPLDVLRRAADRDVCIFPRNWTRPSIDMLLPEMQSMRQAGRLLSLAARREAADGNAADAIRDIVRIQKMGRHAASEPILISALVGLALDRIALSTLADVLPQLRKADLPLLDSAEVADLVGSAPSIAKHFYGEEAFGLSVFADLADGRMDVRNLSGLLANGSPSPSNGPLARLFFAPLSSLFRSFFVSDDVAAYRSNMKQYQMLAANPPAWPELKKRADQIEKDMTTKNQGLITSLMTPALTAVLRSRVQSLAQHEAATALVAATRQRLAAGGLPATLDELVPGQLPAVPRDPFATDTPLLLRRTDSDWTVYSVGPDGEDDGGPVRANVENPGGNDDIGLLMKL
jgi:hypothetical protein